MNTERQITSKAGPSYFLRLAPRVGVCLPRRLTTVALVAGVVAGLSITGCSDITGPDSERLTPATKPLLHSGSGNFDDDDSPHYPSKHGRKTDEEAENDPVFRESVETVFPITEAVFNPCRNELVVLNGFVKTRMRTETDLFGGLKFKLTEFKDTRGVFGTVTYEETYWDDDDDSWKKRTRVVKYRNRESLLDRFEVGPFGAPFRSEFVSKMHLEREGPDPYYVKQLGDDLFVFVRESVRIGTDGVPQIRSEFRTECK
jgi:hypothetical protein